MAPGLKSSIIILLLLALALPAVHASIGASPVTITGTIEGMQPHSLDWQVHDGKLEPKASATIAADANPPRYLLTLTFHQPFNSTTISIFLADGESTINRTFTKVSEWETIHANITAETQDNAGEPPETSRQVSSPTNKENKRKIQETFRQARLKNLSYFKEKYNISPDNTSKQAYRAEPQMRSTMRRKLTYKPGTRNVLLIVLSLISITLAGYYIHLLRTR